MEVTLTTDQQAFVKLAMETGRVRTEEEAVAEALSLWEDRERQRLAFVETLGEARAALARGEGRTLTQQNATELTSAVKERGRDRLDQAARHPA